MTRWHRGAAALILILGGSALAVPLARSGSGSGWRTIEMGNGLVTLEIVPEIGGRIVRYTMGGHQYLLVNRELENATPPPSGLGPGGTWLNYGGDKVWVAPQGQGGPEEWPGPPDAVLDGGPYTARVTAGDGGKPVAVELTSGDEAGSGVRLSRTVRTFPGTSRVGFVAEMRNVDTKPRRWGIWAHTQLDGRNPNGPGHNPDLVGYCPVNPRSMHPKGYWVMFGPEDLPSFGRDDAHGLVTVRYLRREGKIGVDSTAGWVAVVDGTAGYAFVQRYTPLPGRAYPDNATVEFWADGYKAGEEAGRAKEPGYGLESEIIGPFEELAPGASAELRYDWYAARTGGSYPVLDCDPWSVTCAPLGAAVEGDHIKLRGRFGVFYEGRVEVRLKNRTGLVVSRGTISVPVTPLEPLVPERTALGAGLRMVPEAKSAVLVLYDRNGAPLGEIARATLDPR